MNKLVQKNNKLTEAEKTQLYLWASATPKQRLDWLDEAQKIAYQSGAWLRQMNLK